MSCPNLIYNLDVERWAIEIKRSLSTKPEKASITPAETFNPAKPLLFMAAVNDIRLLKILKPSTCKDWQRCWLPQVCSYTSISEGSMSMASASSATKRALTMLCHLP
jgi:hypothetical protein